MENKEWPRERASKEKSDLSADTESSLNVSERHLYPDTTTIPVSSAMPLGTDNTAQYETIVEYKYDAPNMPEQFLSGVIITVKDISKEDCETIARIIEKYGGQYREELSRDVTYLLCKCPTGKKYIESVEYHIPAIVPHWLDDSIRSKTHLDIDPYQLPSPVIFTSLSHPATLYSFPNMEEYPPISDSPVLQNQVLYFTSDIILKDDYKKHLMTSIDRAGGRVALRYSRDITIVIAKYRIHPDLKMAYEENKLIASLWWLTNTLSRGYLKSPLSTLLDYPIPKGGIPEMEQLSICITGYRQVARDYLRRLLVIMGAIFNPIFDDHATHLICGGTHSNKYKMALNRPGVSIVNHAWLEECYQQWKIMPTRDDRYAHIPEDNTILNSIVGRTHLIKNELKRWIGNDQPDCVDHKHVYKIAEEGEEEEGVLVIRKPRKAAIHASQVLQEVIIPDVNQFESELKKNPIKRKR